MAGRAPALMAVPHSPQTLEPDTRADSDQEGAAAESPRIISKSAITQLPPGWPPGCIPPAFVPDSHPAGRWSAPETYPCASDCGIRAASPTMSGQTLPLSPRLLDQGAKPRRQSTPGGIQMRLGGLARSASQQALWLTRRRVSSPSVMRTPPRRTVVDDDDCDLQT